jgi:EAL domain-containing protein (putative c-di-GMP-specific phosphodiesterase class I)
MTQIVQHSDNNILDAMVTDYEDDVIQASLDFVREHLGMEVAYLSEFIGDNLVFRRVSAPGFEAAISVGDSMPLDQVYCPHIIAGRLPELIPDTAKEPFTQTIALTKQLPIGSHVSIPIIRTDGTNYGMFCCLSTKPRPSLNQRDHDVVSAFARISSETINSVLSNKAAYKQIENSIRSAINTKSFSIVYQPIIEAKNTSIRGFEALCRFEGEPYLTPDLWFLNASKVGLQVELEVCVIEKALQALNSLPKNIYLSLNASPATVLSGCLLSLFDGWPTNRIVLELTEHEIVSNYDDLMHEIELLRKKGIRIAIDDAGAGYSGLQQIIKLAPDIIKLDISLTSNIDTDIAKRSLATAMVQFANDTNALIVAEGVETEGEFLTLKIMSVDMVQGYLLGRPKLLENALALCDEK